MAKNAFYFMLKAFYVRYLNFCRDFFGHLGKRVYKKANFSYKIYDVQTGQQIITIHILLEEVKTTRQ